MSPNICREAPFWEASPGACADTNYPSPNAAAGKVFDDSSSIQSRLQRRINDSSRLQREAIKDLQFLHRPGQAPAAQPVSPKNGVSVTTLRRRACLAPTPG